MKLRYKWHSYNTVEEHEAEVPDDTVFIHVDGDIGPGLHHGFGHYLGCSTQTVERGHDPLGVRFYDTFPGLSLFAFYNVIFESEIKIIPWEEFFDKFDIGNCYVVKSTKEGLLAKGHSIEEMLKGNYEIVPSRLVSISKIIRMESQNMIDMVTCTVSSWLGNDDREVLGINLDKDMDLMYICNSTHNDVVIKRNIDKEFTNAMNQVLRKVNKKAIDI